jgi:hypothetical protein
LMILIMPMPAAPGSTVDPAVTNGIRIGMGAFSLALCAIGVWWLVFFNRQQVMNQFAPNQAGPSSESASADYALHNALPQPGQSIASPRPLSITIIACFMLMGSSCVVFAFWAPAVFFTKVLIGLSSSLVYLAYGIASVVIGIGLLRLKSAARVGAIIFYVFACLNTMIFYFAPGAHDRMSSLLAREQEFFPWMRAFPNQTQFNFDDKPFLLVGAACALLGTVVPLYFLITRKAAFDGAAAPDKTNS